MSRVAAKIECSKEVFKELQDLANDQSNPRIALRASMVLESMGEEQIKDIASRHSWRPATIIKWRQRFSESGIAGLKNLPRGISGGMYGAPFREQLLETLGTPPPDDQLYWTGQLLAEALDVPIYIVTRYLRQEGIRLLDERRKRIGPLVKGEGKQQDPKRICEDKKESTNLVEEDSSTKNTPSKCTSIIPLKITWEENSMENGSKKLDVEVIVRVKDENGVIFEENAESKGVLPSIEQFNIETMEGYLEDLDTAEKAFSSTSDAAIRGAFGKLSSEIVKKNLIAPRNDVATQLREAETMHGRTTILVPRSLTVNMKPKERIMTLEMRDTIKEYCEVLSYRDAAYFCNKHQRRKSDTAFSYRTIADYINREGQAIYSYVVLWADGVLREHNYDLDTLQPPEDSEYRDGPAKYMDMFTLYESRIAEFNKDREDPFRIKDVRLVNLTETDPPDCVYCCLDGILSARQKEANREYPKSNKKGKKPKKYVENIVIWIQYKNLVYRFVAKKYKDAIKFIVAFLLHNNYMKKHLVFFADGANDIKDALEKYLPYKNYELYLDWYHLEKKDRENLSMAIKGKKEERNQIRYEVNKRLWVGNVDDAISYLRSVPQKNIKNQSKLEDAIAYIERKRPFIGCYAFRRLLGLINSSNRVEKSNDLIVGDRQKGKCMSWSWDGSNSLAMITVVDVNGEADTWNRKRVLSFKPRNQRPIQKKSFPALAA